MRADTGSRIAAGALVGAFGVAGLALNDAMGLGHRASGVRVLAVLVGGPVLGAIAAKVVVRQARGCVTWLLAAAGLAGLVGSFAAIPWVQPLYDMSRVAALIEPAPPPAPYVNPVRGMFVFMFLASWLAAVAATYYERE